MVAEMKSAYLVHIISFCNERELRVPEQLHVFSYIYTYMYNLFLL